MGPQCFGGVAAGTHDIVVKEASVATVVKEASVAWFADDGGIGVKHCFLVLDIDCSRFC
jgi:hypothetical protein